MQDPEGILSAPKGGHIARRQLQKQIVDDKDLQEQLEKERQKARAELQARREVGAHIMHQGMHFNMMHLTTSTPTDMPGDYV